MTNYQVNAPDQERESLTPFPDHQPTSDRELIKAVSGYGRELFFSNILDYIAKHLPEVIKSALKEFLPKSGFDKIERENRHMDLVFFNRDADGSRTPVLVIENKRGSIATARQLEKYTGKITDIKKSKSGRNSECLFLLVSPHFFEKGLAASAGWRYMGYAELGERLNSSINEYAEKNPHYKDTLEYKLLDAATAYMLFLEEESTRIYKEVSAGTQCPDLHPEGDSVDNVKLRYCAVARMLIHLLGKEGVPMQENGEPFSCAGQRYVEAWFDSGVSSPLVNMEIKNLVKIKDKYGNFIVQFQGDCISIGLGMKGIPESFDKKQKKEHRRRIWEENDIGSVLWMITGELKCLADYDGTGYMTPDYILPMCRLNVRDRTVGDIVETMCRYAKGALAYSQNILLNP